jgi:hypothetical protein
VLRSIVRRDASVLENHRRTMGGTVVTLCVGLFYETCCKWSHRERPAERAHTMRRGAHAQYDGSVYDDWVKCSPQNMSLRGVVNVSMTWRGGGEWRRHP